MKYKLVRMKRKSLVINISDGIVTVKAPVAMPLDHIEEFVEKKSGWIEKKLAAFESKTALLGDVIDGTHALYHGAELDICVSDAHKRISADGAALYVPAKYDTQQARQKAIAAWYRRVAARELGQRLKELAALTGHGYGEFALTNAKSKWGSCDGKCNIRLNWRLVMTDAALTDYVIIHELAHTVHHDHSKAFWSEVGKYYPRYAAARKQLKTYSVLMPLYR